MTPTGRSEQATIAERLVRAFEGRVRGRLRTDLVARMLYATDASPYKIVPAAVLVAGDTEDLGAALEVCRSEGTSITPRGAGTSLSGQCVGPGLQLDCSALNRIEWIDPARRLARVQPGVTWWQLNKEAKAYQLEFGPDPATKRQCTLGGTVASNAGGTHSIIHGAAVDHVEAVDVLLADGSSARLVASSDGSLRSAGAPPALAEGLEGVRHGATPLLGPRFFTLARRGSGYQLEHLCVDRPHLGKVIAGSEGTLALITALELSLDPLPAARVLALVGFGDLHAAMAAVPQLVLSGPCAIELVSRPMLEIARRDPLHAHVVAEIPREIGAILFVEYQGSSLEEAAAGFGRMERALSSAGGVLSRTQFTHASDCARAWAIREAGIGALSAVAGGPRLPQAFVEDTIVAVDRLPGYIREFERLFAAREMEPVWYGHASTGLIHVRPFLDLTSAADVDRIEPLMADVVELVNAWGGDLCGEHGDGLSRSYWNERLFGPEIYSQLRALKAAFDPTNMLNPGKVVEGPRPTESLRYGPGYRRRSLVTTIDFTDQGGFAAAAERCFGAGLCRKRETGVMCPPAAVTGLEDHSTRARANLLRSVVAGDLDPLQLGAEEAREVMETCVMCKACKTECPARVDMARLKAEWADLVRRREGARPLQRVIANLRRLSALGSTFAPLANEIMRWRWVKRRLGIAPQRALPRFVRRPLTRRLPRRGGAAWIYPDCFTTYQEPEIGEATALLVESAGRTVALAPAGCCGRVMLSEGYAEKARKSARRSAAALRRTAGTVIFCEPSCMSMVTDDWPHLIGDVSDIVARCRLAEDYVAEIGTSLPFRGGGRVVFHGHCHQKALWGTDATERALRLVPDLDLEVLDAGCCGMAGGFGYVSERYELSEAIAERVLVPALEKESPDVEVVANGTSCRHQIADMARRQAEHPLRFLARRLLGVHQSGGA